MKTCILTYFVKLLFRGDQGRNYLANITKTQILKMYYKHCLQLFMKKCCVEFSEIDIWKSHQGYTQGSYYAYLSARSTKDLLSKQRYLDSAGNFINNSCAGFLHVKQINKHCNLSISKCDALRDFLPSVQFKKRKKHPWNQVGKVSQIDL